jgi:hypothetical protein
MLDRCDGIYIDGLELQFVIRGSKRVDVNGCRRYSIVGMLSMEVIIDVEWRSVTSSEHNDRYIM